MDAGQKRRSTGTFEPARYQQWRGPVPVHNRRERVSSIAANASQGDFAADAHAAFPEFQGIAATGERVQVRAMDMFRIADGGAGELVEGGRLLVGVRVEDRGSHHLVELRSTPGGLAWSCECPVGSSGEFCAHCVAAALIAWRLAPERRD